MKTIRPKEARSCRLLTVGLSLLLPFSLYAQIGFYGIGDLAGGDINSQIRDATRVGGNIVAVGAGTQYLTGTTASTGDTPVIWVQGTGLSALTEIASSASISRFVTARVISSDGATIGGSIHNSSSVQSREPSLWTSGGAGLSALGYLGSFTAANFSNGGVNGLSSNGAVAYGFSAYDSTGTLQAFRYTAGGGKVALGFLNPGDDGSAAGARAVSSDGAVMLGTSFNSATSSGFGAVGSQAFRYAYTGSGPTQGTMTAMALLPGGSWNSALALTADGATAFGVGDSTSFPVNELVRWNSSGVATALGSPDPTQTLSNIGGVTGDGSVVVVSVGPSSYFYNSNGWFNFQTAMTNAGVDLTGWSLDSALGISSDGTLVFGTGLHNGSHEGFVFDLPAGYLAGVTAIPEPSTDALLIAVGAAALVLGRRRLGNQPGMAGDRIGCARSIGGRVFGAAQERM